MSNRRWWLYAIGAYFLSLPLLLWKSSHLGKLLTFLLGGLLSLWLLTKLITLGFQVYTRVLTLQSLLTLKQEIAYVETNLSETRQRLLTVNRDLTTLIENTGQKAQQQLQVRLTAVMTSLDEIEQATADLRQNQRQLVKQRIIEIKEKVTLLRKPLESASIRKEIEEIIPGLNLLREDEKARFLKDLESIGFQVKGMKQTTDQWLSKTTHYLSRNGGMLTTGSVIMFQDEKDEGNR